MPQRLHEWVRSAERNQGLRPGLTTDERERMKALERENRELRQANEILKKGVGVFCPGGARPPSEVMIAFIDENRDEYGVDGVDALPTASMCQGSGVEDRYRGERPRARLASSGWIWRRTSSRFTGRP